MGTGTGTLVQAVWLCWYFCQLGYILISLQIFYFFKVRGLVFNRFTNELADIGFACKALVLPDADHGCMFNSGVI